jgi:hypothetical protein
MNGGATGVGGYKPKDVAEALAHQQKTKSVTYFDRKAAGHRHTERV